VEVMKFNIYVRVEGSFFDPEKFNARLPIDLRGEVYERKHMRQRDGCHEMRYWRSRVVEVESEPERALTETLNAHKLFLTADFLGGIAKVSAQMVFLQSEGDDARGVFICSDLVRLLAELNADLDVDVVHDLRVQVG